MSRALRPLALAVLLLAAATHAHAQALRSVLGNGGTLSTNGALVLQGTVGQAVIGQSAGPGVNVGHGFWTYAGTSNVGVTPQGSGLPQRFEIGNARPSPARGSVRFAVRLPSEGNVQVSVFDASGRKVSGAFSRRLPAGTHSLDWAAMGSGPGVYFARFAVDGRFMGARRIVMVK
jgi:hypothetical protein